MLSERTENSVSSTYSTLLAEIEKTRASMVMIANEKGFTSPQTIETSQHLDQLLNNLFQLKKQAREKVL